MLRCGLLELQGITGQPIVVPVGGQIIPQQSDIPPVVAGIDIVAEPCLANALIGSVIAQQHQGVGPVEVGLRVENAIEKLKHRHAQVLAADGEIIGQRVVDARRQHLLLVGYPSIAMAHEAEEERLATLYLVHADVEDDFLPLLGALLLVGLDGMAQVNHLYLVAHGGEIMVELGQNDVFQRVALHVHILERAADEYSDGVPHRCFQF